MRFKRLSYALVLVSGVLVQTSCERVKKTVHWPGSAVVQKASLATIPGSPTEDDMRVAREVMTMADVLAMLQANVPNEKIVEEVKRRRLPQVMVDANELELAANGAGHVLIAALKDPQNTLTENQDKAYSVMLTERLSKTKKTAKRQ